jgi:hypothetical protein
MDAELPSAPPSDGWCQALSLLPETFTYAQARSGGLSKHAVYWLRDAGQIEVLGRGLYRQADAEPADLDLIAIAMKAPLATLCLNTALVRHGCRMRFRRHRMWRYPEVPDCRP